MIQWRLKIEMDNWQEDGVRYRPPNRRYVSKHILLFALIFTAGAIAAIVLPVLASARMSADNMVCMENMGDLIEANKLYMEDFDDTLPLHMYGEGDGSLRGPGYAATVFDTISSYGKAKGHLLCPSDHAPYSLNDVVAAASGGRLHARQDLALSYGMNFGLFGNQVFVNPITSVKSMKGSEAPVRTVLFFDSHYMSQGQRHDAPGPYGMPPVAYDLTNFPGIPRHDRGRIRIGMIDGHASSFSPSRWIPERFGKDGKTLVYHFPYDLHGVPDGEPEPRFYK